VCIRAFLGVEEAAMGTSSLRQVAMATVDWLLGKRSRQSRYPEYLAEPLERWALLAVTGTLPVLMIVVEGGPGSEHDMHSGHDLAYFRQIFCGAPGSAMTLSPSINYSDTPGGAQGHFSSDAAFPDGNGDDFAIKATANLMVMPGQEGIWTFGVNSDDGARLSVDGADGSSRKPAGTRMSWPTSHCAPRQACLVPSFHCR
jgi:hypothetical protein